MADALWIGYMAGLIAGGIVAFISYLQIKQMLTLEINMYKRMNKDMDDLIKLVIDDAAKRRIKALEQS